MSVRLPMPVGSIFGLYTVIDPTPASDHKNRLSYLCRCSCGTEKYVNASNLRRGRTFGCGCERNIQTSNRSKSHGQSKTPLYAVWLQAKYRCRNPRHKQYEDYGGRGINICESWFNSFEAFKEDMGEPPFDGAMLERVDNSKGYTPSNCIWATRTQQNRNRRNTRLFEFNGVSMVLAEWAKKLSINQKTLVSRLYGYGWSVEKAFTTPVGETKPTCKPNASQ